jgi:hypothetical protein
MDRAGDRHRASALQMLREVKPVDLLFTDINLGDAVTCWNVAAAGRLLDTSLAVIYASGGPDDPGRRVAGGLPAEACVAGRSYGSLFKAHVCRRKAVFKIGLNPGQARPYCRPNNLTIG